MKKSLVALAVLAASGSTFAQSSVTLYGRIDLGLVSNSSAAGVAGASPKLSMASGQAGASRFGVRGTEDLGGGLKADFLVEAGLAADTGGVTQLGDRNIYAQLSGGMGAVRLGRFLNPQLLQVGKFSAFGTDYAGSGGNIMHVEAARYNNAVSYTTPTISGFSATVMTAFEESNTFRVAQPQGATASTSSTANNASSPTGNAVPAIKKPVNIGLSYANGPVSVGVAIANDGVSGPKSVTNFGASYNLGFATLMAQIETNENITSVAGKDAYLIGATAPMGAGLLRVSMGKRDASGIEFAAVPAITTSAAFQPANSTPNISAYKSLASVGYDYNLSKRTALYATYTRAEAFSAAIGKFNVVQLGVGHNF
jgi:predicted porin